MNRCYSFIGGEKFGQFIARLPDNSPVSNDAMDNILAKTDKFPCELVLKKKNNSITDPIVWHDYMYNEFAYYMVSDKLKNFISNHFTKNDQIGWIEVIIRHNTIKKKYYVIKFECLPDVLDKTNTSYIPNTDSLLVPCIDISKAEKYSVFPLRMVNGKFPSLLYTTDKLKKELKKANFSNLVFEKSKTSQNGNVLK